jgi:hypothetical protein
MQCIHAAHPLGQTFDSQRKMLGLPVATPCSLLSPFLFENVERRLTPLCREGLWHLVLLDPLCVSRKRVQSKTLLLLCFLPQSCLFCKSDLDRKNVSFLCQMVLKALPWGGGEAKCGPEHSKKAPLLGFPTPWEVVQFGRFGAGSTCWCFPCNSHANLQLRLFKVFILVMDTMFNVCPRRS